MRRDQTSRPNIALRRIVKNQFFADSRDYFKYDLLLELLETMAFPGGLTYIPMLTKDDDTGHGGITSYPCGSGRRDLYWFLRYCLGTEQRDILLLRRFFRDLPHGYRPYRDDHEKNGYFTHENRAAYFRGISSSGLAQSLVFLDPDTGLEVRSKGHRHVLYDELRSLIDRMGDSSVMVVFQFLPPVDRLAFFSRIRRDFEEKLALADPIYVSDNQVAFFVMAKADHKAARARETMEGYAKRRGLLFSA